MLKKPVIIAAIGYIIGILWGIYVKNISLFLCWNCIIILIYTMVSNCKKNHICRLIKYKVKQIVLVVFIILSALGYANVYYIDNKYESLYKEEKIEVMVISTAKEGDYYKTYTAKVKNYNIKVYLRVNKNVKLKYGDYIYIYGKIERPQGQRNRYGFDYSRYLKGINNAGTIKIDKDIRVNKHSGYSFGKIIYNLRENIRKHIYDVIKTENKFIIESLLLGDRENLSEEIEADFRRGGLSHLLAISGTHIAIISAVFIMISKIIRLGKNFTNILNICILICYIFIAGGSPSIIRACISCILILMSRLIYRRYDIYINLSVSSIIILFINPHSIFNLSFILSYAGVFGIIMYNSIKEKYQINKLILSKIKTFLIMNKIPKIVEVIISNIIETSIISMCIQIILTPILINNFNSISLMGVISNICATPILSIIISISVFTIILSYICMPISIFIGQIINILVNILLGVAKICANLPFTNVLCTRIDTIIIIIYYVILMYILYLIKINRIHIIKYFIKKNIRNIVFLFITINVLINVFYITGIKPMEIDFIDVGQGDAIIIKTPHGKTILVDGGGEEKWSYRNKVSEDTKDKENEEKVLLPYLLNHKVKLINYAIISHFHADHCGKLLYIMEKIKIKNVIIGKQFEKNENLDKFLEIINNKKINVIIAQSNSRINIEKNLYFEILAPNENNIITENILNNRSLVCKLIYNDFSMLFTGDIEEMAEKDILKEYKDTDILKCTVLKVSHHGSNTSSINEFLKCVKAQIALIGVGNNNKFGHPSKETLEKLKYMNCKVYRTDINGEINIIVNCNKVIKVKKLIE